MTTEEIKKNKRFWEFVEIVDLTDPNRDNSDKYTKEFLLEKIAPIFTYKEYLGFSYFTIELVNFLSNVCREQEISMISSDINWDLKSTVISNGYDFFLKVINDDSGEILNGMINDNNIIENFSCVFINESFIVNRDLESEWKSLRRDITIDKLI